MSIFNAIKSQLSIVTVVSEYVTLKRAGSYYKGPCPFHHERTPSFTVTPAKEIFYCFSCHAGGDVINFIAQAEQCSPGEAAQHLIERYQLTVSSEYHHELKSSPDERQRHTLLCKLIADWCHEQLAHSPLARQYLAERGITNASIKRFALGYMPQGEMMRKQLLTCIQNQGFLLQDVEQIRFFLPGKQGFYSPFENRIIFPIQDYLGRTCGFGGRIFITGDTRPKYYNSHDHTHFTKGSLLFGLDLARRHVQTPGFLFVVEGYTDCIAMTQAGMLNTVATLGTACTKEHLTLISRYAPRICTIYDGDKAGIEATLRLGKLCWEQTIDLSLISLPSNYDPDTYLREQRSFDALPQQDIFSFYMQSLHTTLEAANFPQKLEHIRALLRTINEIADPLKQDLLMQKAAHVCGIPQATLIREATRMRVPHKTAPPSSLKISQNSSQQRISKSQKENTVFAMSVFCAILNSKEYVLPEDERMVCALLGEPLSSIFTKSQTYKISHPEYLFSSFFTELTAEEQGVVQRIMTIQEGTASPEVTAGTLSTIIAHVHRHSWKKTVHMFQKALLEAQKNNDIARVTTIMERFQSLKQAMHTKGLL